MALHYVLDGYNIIKRISALSNLTIEQGRESLIRLLETQSPQGSRRNKVTVVFDGQPGMGGHSNPSYIQVKFSCGESADDQIKRFVEKAGHQKTIVVVTDDRDIQYYVRAHGATVASVDEFFSKVGAQPSSRQKSGPTDSKQITKSLEFRINKELKEIWLGEKDKRKKV